MAFNFPAAPILNQVYTSPEGLVYTWNGYGWLAKPPAGAATGDFVEIAGDTMTGDLAIAKVTPKLTFDQLGAGMGGEIDFLRDGVREYRIQHGDGGELIFTKYDAAGANGDNVGFFGSDGRWVTNKPQAAIGIISPNQDNTTIGLTHATTGSATWPFIYAAAGISRWGVDPAGRGFFNPAVGGTPGTLNTNYCMTLIRNSSFGGYFCDGGDGSASGSAFISSQVGAVNFYVGYGGSVYSTYGSITVISDSSLKTDVVEMTYGLEAIMQLRPISYLLNDERADDRIHFGFMAEEVQAVIPELVETSTQFAREGEPPVLTLAEGSILIPLVKAVQELAARVQQLEAA